MDYETASILFTEYDNNFDFDPTELDFLLEPEAQEENLFLDEAQTLPPARRRRGRPRIRPRRVQSYQPIPPRVFSTGGEDRDRRVRQKVDELKSRIIAILPNVNEHILNFFVSEHTLHTSLSEVLDTVCTQTELIHH